jgi:tetratricopeptide (TPR) repeat protein
MTNETIQDELTPEERAKLKKQLTEQAVKLAVSGRWQEALQVNREYVRIFPNEADGYNRIGKALSELGHVQDALDAYQRALELDPTNQIAKRNIDRLAALRDAPLSAPPTQVDTRLFVEETGTAAVASLQAVDPKVVALLDAGDIVQLDVQGNAVNVVTVRGEYVGMIEPRIGLRLARMMRAGNQYSAAMVSTGDQPKVILRETFKHPSMIDKVSFPQSRLAEIRAYTRRGLLHRDEDEGEWGYDEDEEVEDETDEGWSETGDDLETTPDVDVEDDEEGFE